MLKYQGYIGDAIEFCKYQVGIITGIEECDIIWVWCLSDARVEPSCLNTIGSKTFWILRSILESGASEWGDLQVLRIDPELCCIIASRDHLYEPLFPWPFALRVDMEVAPTKCGLHGSPFRSCMHTLWSLKNTKVWHPQPSNAFEWSQIFLQVLCLQAVILIVTDYLEVMNFNACPNYTSCEKGRDDTHRQCGLLRLGFSSEIPLVQDCPAHRTPCTWLPQNLTPTNKHSISIQSLGDDVGWNCSKSVNLPSDISVS